MTAINAIGAAAPMPTQHHSPSGGCGNHPPAPRPVPLPGPGLEPMPMPMPMPDHHPAPPVGPPIGMQELRGESTRDIARGIINLYDGNRDGAISSEEAVRVQRDHGGFHGSPFQLPGGHSVDVFAMTELFVKADANRSGRVGVNELTKVLSRFDTGDQYRQLTELRPPSEGDGRLTGSEFDNFMSQLGEQHVGSFDEPAYAGPWGRVGGGATRFGNAGPAQAAANAAPAAAAAGQEVDAAE